MNASDVQKQHKLHPHSSMKYFNQLAVINSDKDRHLQNHKHFATHNNHGYVLLRVVGVDGAIGADKAMEHVNAGRINA
jgi:hypothetical protein